MGRLFLVWLFYTTSLFVFYYFVDKVQKKETAKWTGRFAWCGILTAMVLGIIVFLERL